MSGRLVLAFLAVSLACGVGCDRTESERSPVSSAQASQGHPATVSPRPSAEEPKAPPEPSCVVPLPASPAPAASAAAHCPPSPDEPPELPRGSVRFPDSAGDVTVGVEVARLPAHRQRGLMYRTQLGEDEGMLFSWPREAPRSFWMRNTCLPLDMLFISADGVIVGILEQVPTLNEAPRSVACPAAHVLEVNAGWARAHGVEPGHRVEFDT